MRACLVLGRVKVFGVEGADRERGLDFLVVRAVTRVEVLDLDLDLVMGIQPRPSKAPAGQDREARIRHFKVTTATLRSNPYASQI